MTSYNRRSGTTRRHVLKAGAAGVALTGALGIAPRILMSRPAHAADLAAGMTGGPTGFPGAERYQYNGEMSEGRAIEGIKALKAAGKAPEKLVLLMIDASIGQFTKPFPEGATTLQSVWEAETGIKLEMIGGAAEDVWKKVLQDTATQSGAYDIYFQPWNNVGDLVEAGGAYNLDEFVAKYKPDWFDEKRGTPTPEIGELLYKYAGSYYTISFDGDFQTWVYRKDLFDDPANQKEFEAKYKWPLGHPQTWAQVDQIAEFFKGKGLNGHTNLLSPFWGLPVFYARYVSQASPNHYFFDENGVPLLDTDQGIKAAEEHVRSLQWANKDALSWIWAEQYGSMANLQSAMCSTYTNIAKFNDRYEADGKPATPLTGKLSSFLPPGNKFGDTLIRRSVIYYNINAEVSAQSKHAEAAYLFLQWASSTRIYSLLSANPGGTFDPFQSANFDDPLVVATYHDYHVPVIRETIRRSCPSINFAGQNALDNALDEQLQAALTGQIKPAEAMKKATESWKGIIAKRGEAKMVDAIRKNRSAWPTLVEKA